ncbi:solute carrier family 22 member 7-like [Oratosquilla oratoria]|uniref:solute carrier family 22 member 7-like n=1 Tax=Oratosquilla oratoria TaxID=337810 RepID=UPI003F777597
MAADDKTPSGDIELKRSQKDTEAQEVTKESQTFEDLLELAGTNGIWNYGIITLIYLGGIPSALIVLSYQFVGATPEYWCHIPALHDANWTDQQIRDFAIPMKADGKLEGCLQRDYNYSLAASLGYEAAKENLDLITNVVNGTVSCPKRDFNHTQYKSTLVTEFDLVCERRALYSTTSSIVQVGMLFASLTVGHITDLFGKRRTVLVCYLLIIIFGVLSAVSPNVEIFILCKFFMSLFNLARYISVFVLILEFSSKNQRSYTGSISGISWALGQMVLPGIAYQVREWNYLSLALTAPNLMAIIFIWVLPESPRWLILQGRYEDTMKMLKNIARWNKRTLPSDKKLLKMIKSINIKDDDNNVEDTGKNLLKRAVSRLKDLFQTRSSSISTLIMFFSWFTTAFVYYGVSLSGSNIGSNEYWYVFFGGLVEIPSVIILIPLAHYLGRRPCLIGTFVICAVTSLGALGVQGDPVWRMVLSLAGKFASIASFLLVYLISAELNTTKARTLAVGISSVIARVGSMLTPYVVDLIGDENPTAPATMFGVVSCVAAFLAFFLPETRKSVLPESHADVANLKSKKKSESQLTLQDTVASSPSSE